MEKDFDGWNELKKKVHGENKSIFVHPRELWWCSLGTNIGVEIDGKNTFFERPILVMRVYNKEALLILPLTSKSKNDNYHYRISEFLGGTWVKLTQARVISSKRLVRKIGTISEINFSGIRNAFRKYT